MAERETTARVIARNINMLLERSGLEAQQVAIRARIGIRTMAHLKVGSNPTIDTVDAVARVFGLPGWMLLNPNLSADIDNQEWLDRIRAVFGTAPQEGVDLVKRAVDAAETMAALRKGA